MNIYLLVYPCLLVFVAGVVNLDSGVTDLDFVPESDIPKQELKHLKVSKLKNLEQPNR